MRLLELNLEDDALALAVDETTLRSRYAGIAPDTLHVYRGHGSVFFSGELEDWANVSALKEQGLKALRVNSVENKAVYSDPGTINFAITGPEELFKKGGPEYKPVLSEYQAIFEGVGEGLKELGLETRADPKGVYSETGKLSFGFPYWLTENFLLFRGCIFIDTKLEIASRVMITREKLTSVAQETGGGIEPETAKAAIMRGFERRLGVKLNPGSLLEKEKALMTKLHRRKYTTPEWNERGKEPHFSMLGEKLVEVYVANPPTSKCRELISLVREVVSRSQETKFLVWLRGAGEDQNPGEIYSPGMTYVSKAGMLPAVVVNGKVMFAREIPRKEDLEKAILSD